MLKLPLPYSNCNYNFYYNHKLRQNDKYEILVITFTTINSREFISLDITYFTFDLMNIIMCGNNDPNPRYR